MKKRKYSIVMPVYQVEMYLEKMVESVLKQTYSNWELILVDDGSKDGSGLLCDRFSKEDKRIQVFHTENHGLSMARNYGMDHASGDYILFWDSDDNADSDLLEKIEISLNKKPAQLVIYGLIEEYKNLDESIDYTKEISCAKKFFTKPESIHREVIHLEQKTLLGYAWNKAYDLCYLRELNLQFTKITMIEDILFNIEVVKNIKSINLIPDAKYHYAIRHKNSLTAKYLEDYFELHEKRIQALLDLYEYWNKKTDSIMKILANAYCRYFFSALQRNCDKRSNMDKKQQKEWIRSVYQTELYKQIRPHLSPDNGILKILAYFLKKESVIPCWIIAEVIHIVRTKFSKIFDRIKQNR